MLSLVQSQQCLAALASSAATSSTSSVRAVLVLDSSIAPYLLTIAKAGTQVIIPYRDEDEKRFLKVTGDLGQIVSMVCFLSNAILIQQYLHSK